MHISLVTEAPIHVVEGHDIANLEDALGLIAACYEHSADSVLLEASSLPKAFFELRTRFAGEFVQKLVNYQLRVAAVFPAETDYSERFREYVLEASNGPQFRTFGARTQALQWLAATGHA